MLTPDLLPVRRKNGELCLTAIAGKVRVQYLGLAEQIVEIARGSVGLTREQLQAEWQTIGQTPQESRIVRGFAKLVEDATTFEEDRGRGAAERRETLYERAAHAWKVLPEGQRFDRTQVLTDAAAANGVDVTRFEQELFVDLPSAQRVLVAVFWTAEQLVERYEEARVAAILLRAVRVTATFRIKSAIDVRRLFRTLRFRQLLFDLRRLDDGRYSLVLNGPYSLFEAVTRYGLQLALCWPDLRALDELNLEAELRWGKQGERLLFRLETGKASSRTPTGIEPVGAQTDEVVELAKGLRQLQADGEVLDAEDVLDLPGVGLCVPDLRFRAPNGECVHLEVLGYWSRASVWQRVELVERGMVQPVLFVVSSRLRVSEEVLDDAASSALYVYRGRINPAKVMAKIKALLDRASPRPRQVRPSR